MAVTLVAASTLVKKESVTVTVVGAVIMEVVELVQVASAVTL